MVRAPAAFDPRLIWCYNLVDRQIGDMVAWQVSVSGWSSRRDAIGDLIAGMIGACPQVGKLSSLSQALAGFGLMPEISLIDDSCYGWPISRVIPRMGLFLSRGSRNETCFHKAGSD